MQYCVINSRLLSPVLCRPETSHPCSVCAIPQLSDAILRNTSMGFVSHNIYIAPVAIPYSLDAVASCSFDNQSTSDNKDFVNFLNN